MKRRYTSLNLEDDPNCPYCDSTNTGRVTDYGRCLCGGSCWGHPECFDCGFSGYMNSEGVFWFESKKEAEKFLERRKKK